MFAGRLLLERLLPRQYLFLIDKRHDGEESEICRCRQASCIIDLRGGAYKKMITWRKSMGG